MYTYQSTYGGTTYQYLTRSFTNVSCLTACDNFQSLSALYSANSIQIQLNYFRCYTFEGSNYDDVTNAGTSTNVVCKSTLLFCSGAAANGVAALLTSESHELSQ